MIQQVFAELGPDSSSVATNDCGVFWVLFQRGRQNGKHRGTSTLRAHERRDVVLLARIPENLYGRFQVCLCVLQFDFSVYMIWMSETAKVKLGVVPPIA